MNGRWLSLTEIAQHLGVSKDSIYRWIEARAMPAYKVGRHWKFKMDEVDAWIRADNGYSLDQPPAKPQKPKPVLRKP